MAKITLGRTGIVTDRNGFGALPVQRIPKEDAAKLLRKAYDGGITFFDTARAYTDSEEKLGYALSDVRSHIYIATKTAADNADAFWKDLDTSLSLLKTSYIDIYQFHNPSFCPKPGDGSGLYEAASEAKAQGKIRFIGITNHRLSVAQEAIACGLYDTLQFPFCYLSGEPEESLVRGCREHNMGFIAMKSLSGGLITNSAAAYAFAAQYPDVLPIWGIQREQELDEFLSYIENPPVMTEEIRSLIARDREQLLPGLWLLYALPGRYRDQHLCPHVPAAPPLSFGFPSCPGRPGKDDENQRMPPLRAVRRQVPLWAEHAGTFRKEFKGLRRGAGRKRNDCNKLLKRRLPR